MRAKELQRKIERESNNGDDLFARGRSDKREHKVDKKFRPRSRSHFPKPSSQRQIKTLFKCYHCHKAGHFKRDCPDRKREIGKDESDESDVVFSDGYDSTDAWLWINKQQLMSGSWTLVAAFICVQIRIGLKT